MIPKDQSGFTIVELITTILVMGIVVGSIISIFAGIQSVQNRTSNVDLATRAAQREIETLRNDNYNSLTPGQNINFTNSLPAGLPGNKSGTVVVSEPSAGLRRVDVTVIYYEGSTQRQIKLSSLIGDIGITE